jgi:hypothetical protein
MPDVQFIPQYRFYRHVFPYACTAGRSFTVLPLVIIQTRRQDIFFVEDARNLAVPFPISPHAINPLHYIGGILVHNQPCVFQRITVITVRHSTRQLLPIFCFGGQNQLDTVAKIFEVIIIHSVQKR